MTTSRGEQRVGLLRRAGVLAISLSLLGVGVLLVLRADLPGMPVFAFPAVVLLPLYLAAAHRPLDYELRRDSISITLTQLPLALGVLLVAPGVHLMWRLLAVLIDSIALRRLAPMKVAYNLGGAAFEVGLAATAVGLVPDGEPGPMLWVALYLGLLIGDLVVNLALHANLALLGRRPTARELLQQLWVILVTSTVFTGLTVVAVSAAWFDPATIVVTLALAACLALAYRGHRRQSAREQSTQRLYAFVKDLGPVDVNAPHALSVLEQIRDLLHSRYLDLAVCDPQGGGWRHLVVSEPDSEQKEPSSLLSVAEQVASTGAPSLGGRGRSGESQRMATPLVGTEGLMGVLTAEERLGTVRGFDMGDLRLLETTGAELATALERGRLLADLERAATTDPLTGLANLNETRRRIAELVDRTGRRVVVAALAVDSFREVNDTLGHVVGDELLLEVTGRLRRAVPDALVGRIGGGRFAVAVPAGEAGPEPAMFCLGLRAQVEGSAQLGPVGTHVRLSVGYVVGPDAGHDAATLVRRAETAMYSARHAGGGPVMWEPAYEVQGQRKLAVVMALRDALAAGGIGVVFQPKVDTVSGRVTGAEALARWTHPALGDIGPDEFVPLAEASGLMGPLTASVLKQSLTACRSWQSAGVPGVGVAVNVSAVTLLDPAFVTEVAAAVDTAGVAADLLTLELTEGVLVHDADLAMARMTELRSVGVRLSVDDFGTGYSSLTYLKELPVDEVKIDKGFVDGLANGAAECAVVRAVVDIAHTLGLKVVAEGVERHDQLGILRQLGVDQVQGFLHAVPMPALEAESWLRAREASASG